MFCYARIFDMVVLDLVFIRNGLVCIFMFFVCASWDHFGFVFSNLILLGLVFSVPSQDIGWEERFRNDLFLCRVGRKTLLSYSCCSEWRK